MSGGGGGVRGEGGQSEKEEVGGTCDLMDRASYVRLALGIQEYIMQMYKVTDDSRGDKLVRK